MTQEQIVQLIEIILAFVLPTFGAPLAYHLITKLPAKQQAKVRVFATDAVQYVEQVASNGTKSLTSTDKKNLAMLTLQSLLSFAKIKVDPALLDTFIEGAVYLLNQSQSSISTPVMTTTLPATPTGPLTGSQKV